MPVNVPVNCVPACPVLFWLQSVHDDTSLYLRSIVDPQVIVMQTSSLGVPAPSVGTAVDFIVCAAILTVGFVVILL